MRKPSKSYYRPTIVKTKLQWTYYHADLDRAARELAHDYRQAVRQ